MSIITISRAVSSSDSGNVVGLCRVSERTQASNYNVRSQKSKIISQREVFDDLTLKAIFGAGDKDHERGKLSNNRFILEQAIAAAIKHRAILLAVDWTRFLRSESFDKSTNWRAVPTPEEWDAFFKLTEGVPYIATIEDPNATPAELHSLSVKRGQEAKGNKGGRPSTIPYTTVVRILRHWYMDGWYEGESYAKVAKRYGVSKAAVIRLMNSEIPGRPGMTLKEYKRPADAYRMAYKEATAASK